MTKLKTLTATLAATALVSGIGLAYAQSTDATPQGAPAAADSSTMSSGATTSTVPAGTTSSSAPADTSTTAPADSSTSADTSAELAPQADRN